MLTLFKLIFLTTIFSFILSSTYCIEFKPFKGSWYKAVEHCKINGRMIASITDIHDDIQDKKTCGSGEMTNNQYWIGNYYKLSYTISVEGCYRNQLNTNEGLQEGYQSLRECFGLCTTVDKADGTFAYKNVTGGPNCFCNSNPIGLTLSECLNSLNILWWKYKIHKNGYPTRNETCNMISCTNSFSEEHSFSLLCGSQKKTDQTPNKNLRYVCKNKTKSTILTSKSVVPGTFSFILSDAIATDSDNRNLVCEAIACSGNFTYETIITNCSSNLSGVICLKGIDHLLSTRRTILPTSFSSISVFTNISKLPTNNSSYTITTSKRTSDSNSQGKEIYTTPGSNLTTNTITQVDPTSNLQNTKTYNQTPAAESYVTFSMTNRSTVITSPTINVPSVKPTSTLGLLVGLLATAFVIVIAVVVLLVICRLRRQGPIKNKRFGDNSHIPELHGPHDHDVENASNKEPHIVNNSTYEMHAATENVDEFSLLEQDSNNISNSEYAVVIKKSKMIDNVNNQQLSLDEENLDVIENEYDGLNHNRPDSFTDRKNTTNIYDTALGICDASDSTYVTANHVHVVDKDENCVYDHM